MRRLMGAPASRQKDRFVQDRKVGADQVGVGLQKHRLIVPACHDLNGDAGHSGTTGGLDSEGWYAVAGWRVARTLLPTVRYDTFLEDCSRGSSRQTNYTAGLTWQPVKYLRCQLDYTYEDFAARDVAGRNVVALMLSGIF